MRVDVLVVLLVAEGAAVALGGGGVAAAVGDGVVSHVGDGEHILTLVVGLGLGLSLGFFLFEIIDEGVNELVVGGLEALILDPLLLLEAVLDGLLVGGEGSDVEALLLVLANPSGLHPPAAHFQLYALVALLVVLSAEVTVLLGLLAHHCLLLPFLLLLTLLLLLDGLPADVSLGQLLRDLGNH